MSSKTFRIQANPLLFFYTALICFYMIINAGNTFISCVDNYFLSYVLCLLSHLVDIPLFIMFFCVSMRTYKICVTFKYGLDKVFNLVTIAFKGHKLRHIKTKIIFVLVNYK